MTLIKAIVFYASFASVLASNLLPVTDHQLRQFNTTNVPLLIIEQLTQSGNPTNATKLRSLVSPIITVVCDENFGRGLALLSCVDAIRQMDRAPVRQIWGRRGMGRFSQSLPLAIISSECLDQKSCPRINLGTTPFSKHPRRS